MTTSDLTTRRAAFLAGEGTLRLREVRAWAASLGLQARETGMRPDDLMMVSLVSFRDDDATQRGSLRWWITEATAAIPDDASDGFRLGAMGILDSLSEALKRGDADSRAPVVPLERVAAYLRNEAVAARRSETDSDGPDPRTSTILYEVADAVVREFEPGPDPATLPVSDCFRHGQYSGFRCPRCGPGAE